MRGILILCLVLLGADTVWGMVSGPCSNCHTMHNSQNDSAVYADGPSSPLLSNSCVGCHSHATDTIVDLGETRIPIVFTHSEPTYPAVGTPNSTLAGGNFYWVAQEGGDGYGHNVFGISDGDKILSTAPGTSLGASGGGAGGCADCHATLASSNPVSGCTGCHVPHHHADDSAEVVGSAGGWYRFLGENVAMVGDAGTYGVMGIEEEDWEQNPSSTRHNSYMGTTEVYVKSVNSYMRTEAIGQFCAGCHGNFHHEMNEDSVGLTGAWIRHPSDVLLPGSGEYQNYTVYNPLVPVAKPSLDGKKNSAEVKPGTDVVTCISCHRPHGSPFPDMLRWDYSAMVAGGGNNESGCFVCHSSKDE